MVSVTSNFGKQAASNQANALLLKTKPVADSNSGRGVLSANSNTNPVVAALLKGTASSNNPLAKPLTDQQQKANDTIRTLSQAKKQFVVDRKSAALQKLEQARTKLRLLRSLGGDPKTIAREAKRIAQEISAAAREYGAAVASEGGGGASAVAGQSVTVPAAPAANESGSSASGAEATAGSTPEAAAGQSVQTATGAAAEATSANEKSSASTSESKDSKADSDANPTARATTESEVDAARQKTAQAYQDAAAKTATKFAQARGERDVLEKFKEAAREVKSLIEEAVRKLKAKNAGDTDANEAERAASETDQAVQDLGDAIHAQQIETSDGGSDVGIGVATVDAGASVAINILS